MFEIGGVFLVRGDEVFLHLGRHGVIPSTDLYVYVLLRSSQGVDNRLPIGLEEMYAEKAFRYCTSVDGV